MKKKGTEKEKKSYLFGFPDLDDGHTSDGALGVFFSGGVNGVVGADDEDDVGLFEHFVDIFHLVDHVVRYAGFGQQHVQLLSVKCVSVIVSECM